MLRPIWFTGCLTATLAVTSMVYLTGCAEESELGGPGATDGTTTTNGEATTNGEEGIADGGMTENGIEDGTAGQDTGENGEAVNVAQTFRLQVPRIATNIPQASNDTVTIQLARGDEFNQKVDVTFEPPQGITLEPETLTFEAGVDSLDVTVNVDETAQVGEATIKAHATPETGKAVDQSFQVEVTEKQEQEQ